MMVAIPIKEKIAEQLFGLMRIQRLNHLAAELKAELAQQVDTGNAHAEISGPAPQHKLIQHRCTPNGIGKNTSAFSSRRVNTPQSAYLNACLCTILEPHCQSPCPVTLSFYRLARRRVNKGLEESSLRV